MLRRAVWLSLSIAPLFAQGHAGGRYGGAAPAPTAADARLDAAIEAGIGWLTRHQDEDGKWSASLFVRHDPRDAICDGTGKPDQDFFTTGLAALALAGAGTTLRAGPHRATLAGAVRWLAAQRGEDGFLGVREAGNGVVAHAIATFTLIEVGGLSNRPELRDPVVAAIRRLGELRLDDGRWPLAVGGKVGSGEATLWSALAMVSAQFFELGDARCAEVPDLLAADPSVPPGGGVFLGCFVGQEPSAERSKAVLAQLPRWPDADHTADFVAWHFGTLACWQMGGESWRTWSEALAAAALPHQRTDGSFAGSWDPVDARGKELGRIGATALQLHGLLVLQRARRLAR